MTPEQLLKPRIKLNAPIPKIFSCGIEVGDIWEGEEIDNIIMFNLTGAHSMDLEAVKKYPHLFSALEWWEDRKPEEMPEYIKFVKDYMNFKRGSVYRTCENWSDGITECDIFFVFDESDEFGKAGIPGSFNQCQPATSEEYEAFLTKQKGEAI